MLAVERNDLVCRKRKRRWRENPIIQAQLKKKIAAEMSDRQSRKRCARSVVEKSGHIVPLPESCFMRRSIEFTR
jgi:hypothetical protein